MDARSGSVNAEAQVMENPEVEKASLHGQECAVGMAGETGDVTGEDVEVVSPVDQTAETEPTRKVPDGGWGWMIVIGATLTHFILVGVARCLGIVYILLRERFNSTATETAIVAAVFNTMRSITAPIWGMACDRFGCRAITIIGAMLLSFGFVISSFAGSLHFLIVSLGIVAGTGGAMVFIPAYIMVNQYFDKKKGRAMGFATVGSGVGQVILAPAINALSQTYALFGTFLVLGAIQLNHFVSAALYRPIKRPKVVKELDVSNVDIKESHNMGGEPTSKLSDNSEQVRCVCCRSTKQKFINTCCSSTSLWKNSSFLVYCILIATMQACIVIFLIFAPSYVKDDLGMDNNSAALLVSIFGFADIAGRFLFAFLFDLKKVRHRRRHFYGVISLVCGVMVCVTASMPNFIACSAMAVITGLFEGGCHSQRATILSDFTTKQQAATSVGFIIFSQGLGNMYGPPFSGYLRDTTGTNASALYFAGITYATAAVLFLLEYVVSNKKTPLLQM